ncbi:MAG: low molecular weight protein-tyrosine-phosphatase [Candidatus Nanopelagicus sp.]
MHLLNDSKYLRQLRAQQKIRVLLLCLGNICRSPMANAVLAGKTADLKNPLVVVDSSGTGPWHVGEDATDLSRQVWQQAGYNYAHRAKQFNIKFFDNYDLILAMDLSNRQTVLKMARSEEDSKKIFMFSSFDSEKSQIDPDGPQAERLSVPDPYGQELAKYKEVLKLVEQAAEGFNLWVRS